jgi:alpha-D-xyloside xylohydrolase
VAAAVAVLAGSGCGGGSQERVDAIQDAADARGADAQSDAAADVKGDGAGDTGGDAMPDAGGPGIPAKVVADDGAGHTVEIVPDPLALTAFSGDKVVFAASDAPLRVGVVKDFDKDVRYDPQYPPQDVEWLPLANPVAYTDDRNGSQVLTYEVEPGRLVDLSIAVGGPGIVSLLVSPREWNNEVLVSLLYDSKDATENFYGLGENFDHVARRGTFRHLYHTVDGALESGYNEAHFPIPLLISTLGSGVFVDERRPGVFDVCKADPERVAVTYSAPSLAFHVLFADTPLQVLSRYVELTGKPALPPAWVFGVLQWRNEVSGQAMVMEDAQAMRDNDIPCSGLWVDRPFATGHESFVFNPDRFPDSKKMVQDLNAMGYRVAIWSAPYLSQDVPEAYAEAESNGYFVESKDIQFQKFGKLVDFTNPGLVALWQDLLGNATAIGIEGFKLDYGEDVVTGFSWPGVGSYKASFSFFNGETEQTMHHWYHYFYHKTYQDVLEGDGFLLNRAGCHGDQVVTTVCWPGDLDSDFRLHGQDGHVGGLPAAIAGGLSLSVSGYPFYGSDTGGYRHNRPTKEVLLRWVQQTALSTVLQFGGGGVNHNPWDFTLYEEDDDDGGTVISQYDQETLDVFREFARLHVRLFPYRQAYAVAAHETGVPVQRPLGLVYPELNVHPDFHYLLGDWLWVAPSHAGGATVETQIPPGTWIHWFDRTLHSGPGSETFAVPLGSLTLLVRQSAIVPLLRETVDTLAPATAEGVDSFANTAGELEVRVFPGPESSTFETALGPNFSYAPDGVTASLSFTALTPAFEGAVFVFDLLHSPVLPSAAGNVTLDGKPLPEAGVDRVADCAPCASYDPQEKRLRVHVRQAFGTIAFGP